jgi:hypothetical protein
MRYVRTTLALIAAVLVVVSACRHQHSAPATVDTVPTPTPAPSAQALGCGLGPGGGTGEDCPMESASFQVQVEKAIDVAIREHPEMINTNRARGCPTCWQVLDTHNFPEEVGLNLQKMGLCTTYDGEELAVKNTNVFNDQYDILLAEGFLRREATGSYRATCRPAWF